jgi:hypothetical protein
MADASVERDAVAGAAFSRRACYESRSERRGLVGGGRSPRAAWRASMVGWRIVRA